MEGERILIPERMIVSPADGVFRSTSNNGDLIGTVVNVDDVIGYVDTVGQSIPVTSPSTEQFMVSSHTQANACADMNPSRGYASWARRVFQ